jgi:tripartite-type tricarboxylate transporter receptor subunit TctC
MSLIFQSSDGSIVKTFFRLILLSTALASLGAAPGALAQGYPGKPLCMIVPFAAGGTGDVLGRLLASKMSEGLGQPVVVDFKPGAGTTLGTDFVAKSPPDGYTILFSASTTMSINATLYSKLPYDTLRDLAPVSMLAAIPNMLVANHALPANTVPELIALAKASPGKLNYASPGSGTTPHLAGELFKMAAGINMVHVPYKGAGPAIVDVLGGHVPMLFDNIPSVQPQVTSGKMKAIGVTSAKRSPAMPNVPTFAEAGLAGFEANSWWAILAPAGTPKEIIARLNAEVVKALNDPGLRERFIGLGAGSAPGTPEEAAAHIRGEVAKWAAIVKASGARVD